MLTPRRAVVLGLSLGAVIVVSAYCLSQPTIQTPEAGLYDTLHP